MKNRKIIWFVFFFVLLSVRTASADDWFSSYGGYYRVYNLENNEVLFETARQVYKGDQYLSGDNKMYRVVRVNRKDSIAYAEFIKDVKLPEIDEAEFNKLQAAIETGEGLAALLTYQGRNKKVGIYTTHSSESYLPTDGQKSIKGNGGIKKVAEHLKKGFERNGITAIFDNTNHDPHDAGAYKRSRRTALQLLRTHQVDGIFDLHRDAVPVKAYKTEIKGEPAAKVRIVVGGRNQNFKANEEMALKVKAAGDRMYPGIIKDIFYARGDYNQDLMPRAMLLEMGTYGHTRQRAEKTAGFMSNVLTAALFGDAFAAGPDPGIKPAEQSNIGAGRGIITLIIVIGGGALAFLFISSGRKEWKHKVSNFKQEFYNFMGRMKRR